MTSADFTSRIVIKRPNLPRHPKSVRNAHWQAAASPQLLVWLVTAFLEAILQGMGMLQGFLYFTWYHNKDPWSFKATVSAALDTLECVQMGASIDVVYEWFITGFGDLANLDLIHWQDMLQLTALYFSMFVTPSQAHFARCIYRLYKKNIVLPLLIIVFSLLALSMHLCTMLVTFVLQTVSALAADILITFGLCWRLRKRRSEFQSTNKTLNFLIVTAINRSIFTMFFAVLSMILFLSRPATFDFMIALFVSDKLYMNSLLAMLNTREYAVQVGAALATHIDIAMPTFSSTSARNEQAAAVYIQTTTEVRNDVGAFELESVKIDTASV
ncbi:hypothetical protein GGX14DRAFT_417322 [Mycena pura]|uniref:DUF6534 domain-containing protein n=1 Tax=Mycena pura TaxID=153505 RepID=A0AAD6YQV5_9AGAR|nr:hypothetical protein GGX14DRAFT_417322 [Mycena pura]